LARSTRAAPPNSLVLLSDATGGEFPGFVPGELVLATPSGIVVGCRTFADGPTDLLIGPASEVGSEEIPAFDGVLDTPSRKIVVSTVEGQRLLQETVSSADTRVRIWVNHPTEPDRIVIGLD
jgi:hypothetical protein